MVGSLRLNRLPPGEREFRFDPPRRWRFDFAWPGAKVALEIEGGVWTHGRHNRGQGMEKDAEKYNQAACIGWLVLRATNHMIEDNRAADWVRLALIKRGAL